MSLQLVEVTVKLFEEELDALRDLYNEEQGRGYVGSLGSFAGSVCGPAIRREKLRREEERHV